MAPKKTNIKIKRTRFSLYKKKKSKPKQALIVIVTVIAICGLGVLGYGLGKPLLKYIQDRGNSSQSDQDTSALLSSIKDSINSETTQSSQSTDSGSGGTSSQTSEPEPTLKITDRIYYLPDNAALSEASLKAAVAEAKTSGCAVVAVTLKDTTGHLLYKTSVAEIKDTDAVTGTLTATQIAQAIVSEGLIPAARINTLMDQLAPLYTKGSYTFAPEQGGYRWNDDKDERGGKPWLSPFKTETVTYISDITNELSKAGYKHIICVNTRFPAFHTVDINTYLNHLPLTDPAKRLDALWGVVTAAKTSAEKNGAAVWLEMSAANILAENRNNTDAEVITDKNKLKNIRTVVYYDIPNTSSNASNTSNTSNTSGGSNGSLYYQNAKSFITKAKAALGSAEFAVRLPQTLTGSALEDVKKAFSEADITVF